MRPIDRRAFLELTALLTAGALGSGCASVAMLPVTPEDGVIRLRLRDVPQLALPGGYLKIRPAGHPAPVYVLALSDGGYAALSPVCTHLGCTVDVAGPRLICPCHGSAYARDGVVLRGPAERALHRYRVEELPDGTLLIHLEDA